MLILQDLTYIHPNKEVLFSNIHFTINKQDRAAFVGNNGTGKSTLLKIIAGILPPAGGLVKTNAKPYYVPQIFGQFNHLSIAQALQVADKLDVLHRILDGDVTETNLAILNDDWGIEERCTNALAAWNLHGLTLSQPMHTLSGGQKTKVFLAGIAVHGPEFILLDEPSNHLDTEGRQLLYDFIAQTTDTLMVVSHDRQLLNLLNPVCELSHDAITVYGGDYEFYAAQKLLERNAAGHAVKSTEKALRKAKDTERETLARQQKLDARGKKKQEKAGVPTIAMNTLRNNAEKSTSRIKGVHAEKTGNIAQQLNELRAALPDLDKMKFGFDDAALHKGKILFTATGINLSYGEQQLWGEPLNITITSGERIALKGLNGSGKTSLIKIILGNIEPTQGTVYRAGNNIVYIDQEYSLLNNALNVYEQAQQFNTSALQEHEIKIRLTRFLFTRNNWDKPCAALSGGERMRLVLCCLTISNQAPDIIVLDEPTNNLDLENITILTAAIKDYRGTVIAVSHDIHFLEEIDINREILLE